MNSLPITFPISFQISAQLIIIHLFPFSFSSPPPFTLFTPKPLLFPPYPHLPINPPLYLLPTHTPTHRGSYAGIYASSFRDMSLKETLMQALSACAFESPSEIQQEALPQAIYNHDLICQAKSGTGKTAVFVLATLQQLEIVPGQPPTVDTLVLCHTRELAFQICKEFLRFSKFMPEVKTCLLLGGVPEKEQKALLKTAHIVVGTPGRVESMVRDGALNLKHLKRFILDECDSLLIPLEMRQSVQQIFAKTPHTKQVMMFTATLPVEIRAVCRKFTQNPTEIYVDDETKLTLHGLVQYHTKVDENQKNKKLISLLDALEFNQVVIFVSSVSRCRALNKLLTECNFPSISMYAGLPQTERIARYNAFKEYKSRIMVSTDVLARGVDFSKVNIVINYDMPISDDTYLHRVGRSARFGTKGLAISFVTSAENEGILDKIQSRFDVQIQDLPETIETSSYMA